MKEKIKKYLAGEREGFSLVELIIVIAIMAILVGVVALAVLPNIEKSKESKDFAVLDSVCSALNAAVASTQVSGTGSFELDATGLTGDVAKVQTAVKENLGTGAKTLTSSNAKGAKIYCKYDTSAGVIEAFASADGSTVVKCKYNDQKDLKASN